MWKGVSRWDSVWGGGGCETKGTATGQARVFWESETYTEKRNLDLRQFPIILLHATGCFKETPWLSMCFVLNVEAQTE